MAQVDVKWPSEDEDFDTKTASVDESKKVTVLDQNDSVTTPGSVVTPEAVAPVEETNSTSEAMNSPETTPASDTTTEEPQSAPSLPEETETIEAPAETIVAGAAAPDEAAGSAVETQAEDLQPEKTETEAEIQSLSPEEPQEELQSAPEASNESTARPEPQSTDVDTPADKPQAAPAVVGKHRRHVGRNLLFLALIAALVGLGLWSWGVYADRNNLQQQITELKKNPQDEVQRQSAEIIKKVGAQINLPEGENPTIANVTDAAAAKKESEFFANAQNGDKVLVYVNAGIAVLYRPSTDKVILAAPLTLEKQTGTTSTTTGTQAPVANTRATTNGNTLQ